MKLYMFHNSLMEVNELDEGYEEIIPAASKDYLRLGNSLMALIKVRRFIVGPNLIVKLSLPLPNYEIYDVKKVYAVPRPVNDHFSAVIDLEADYVATSSMGYRFWSKDTFEHCRQVSVGDFDNLRVCDGGPIILSDDYNCLTGLLSNKSVTQSKCKYSKIKTPDVWVTQTEEINRWFYVLRNRTEFYFNCLDGFAQKATLEGAGLLTLKCSVVANTDIFISYQNREQIPHDITIPLVSDLSFNLEEDWETENDLMLSYNEAKRSVCDDTLLFKQFVFFATFTIIALILILTIVVKHCKDHPSAGISDIISLNI